MSDSIDSGIDSKARPPTSRRAAALGARPSPALRLTIRSDIVALVTWQSVPLLNRIRSRATTCTGRLIRMFRQLQLFAAVALIAMASPLGAQDKTAPTSQSVGPKAGKAQ